MRRFLIQKNPDTVTEIIANEATNKWTVWYQTPRFDTANNKHMVTAVYKHISRRAFLDYLTREKLFGN